MGRTPTFRTPRTRDDGHETAQLKSLLLRARDTITELQDQQTVSEIEQLGMSTSLERMETKRTLEIADLKMDAAEARREADEAKREADEAKRALRFAQSELKMVEHVCEALREVKNSSQNPRLAEPQVDLFQVMTKKSSESLAARQFSRCVARMILENRMNGIKDSVQCWRTNLFDSRRDLVMNQSRSCRGIIELRANPEVKAKLLLVGLLMSSFASDKMRHAEREIWYRLHVGWMVDKMWLLTESIKAYKEEVMVVSTRVENGAMKAERAISKLRREKREIQSKLHDFERAAETSGAEDVMDSMQADLHLLPFKDLAINHYHGNLSWGKDLHGTSTFSSAGHLEDSLPQCLGGESLVAFGGLRDGIAELA